jgi:VCBS repeat-containing protein
LGYAVSNVGNAALFSTLPAVASNGTLTYTPAPDAFGTSTFQVMVQDDGGITSGGVDTSAPQTFTITVTGVNDAPSFLAGGPVTVLEDAGLVTANSWATGISPGVAVGIPVTRHPPPRSRRAELPHRALASGSNAQALCRVRMQDSGLR